MTLPNKFKITEPAELARVEAEINKLKVYKLCKTVVMNTPESSTL